MAKLRAGAALAQEAIAAFRRRIGSCLHHLDRDFVAEADTAGTVYRAHSTRTKSGNDFVAIVDSGAGLQQRLEF
jgi:hypothetical protein